jgi:uncharacterized protein YggE
MIKREFLTMKKFTYLLVSVCFLWVSASQSYAENSVSVVGSASVLVAPERMNWSLTLVHKHADLSVAAKQQSNGLKEIIRFLKKMGINGADIQTDNAVFGEDWGRGVMEGYVATTTIQFCIYDFAKYEEIWEGLSHIEGLKVNGTSFEIANSEGHRSEMRKQAVLDAKKRAVELTEPLGSNVGRPIKISEGVVRESYSLAYSQPSIRSVTSSNDTMFSLGMIQVSSQVSITFELTD